MTTPVGTFHARIGAINDVLCAVSMLGWDARTMMPPGGVETRGHQMATLTALARDMLMAPETERALEAAEAACAGLDADHPDARAVAQTRHALEVHRRIPAALVHERAQLRTVAEAAWVEARRTSDYTLFAPHLKRTMALAREWADAVGWQGHPYDALAAQFDAGETAANLKTLFAALRKGIAPILAAARARPPARTDFLARGYDEEGQRAFGLKVAERFGYDLSRGRLDTTVHPFALSMTRNDVRITTRYKTETPTASFFATFHETGHGLYEQNIDPAHTRTALATDLVSLSAGGGAGSGVHESQSRLWENHVARSRDFWRRHMPELRQTFPGKLDDVDADAFYAAVTRVEPGLIRVEADELTYDLHIMLRVDLELALIDGSLDVADLPDAWNAAVKRDLGLDVPNDTLGLLQDVHWSWGYVGSFPSYTVGNVMAAQLMAAVREQVPGLDDALAAGEYRPLGDWLRANIWRHGKRFTRDELLVRATGRALDAEPYVAYLRGKYMG
ncbi:MAG TPA: carboxypeptidase M32 [Azospirillaceae bacterium]|nr:carboxypeptidase M32 [Azospirillaceae bacterium]